MRWGIGAMVVAEFAIITFVDDAMVIGRRKLRDITLVVIDPVQKRVEGRTKIEAAAASVADIIDSQRFLFEGGRIDRLE